MQVKGLSPIEVSDRISKGLQNISSKVKTKTITEIFIENLFSLFNLIILSVVLFFLFFYFVLHDSRLLVDSLRTLSIAVLNTSIAIYQEIKAKRALDKVNLLLKRDVTVIRDEKEVSIDSSEIVIDDVIKISRGDQVVVDGEVIFSNHLEIDESLLTGESNPIHKKESDELLSGSFCLSGNGFYKASKVGDNSFASSVTRQAKKYKFDLTPLQKKINFIVKILFAAAVVLVIASIALNNNGFDADFVRKISTILISLIPQGLVLMATVTFALGVYRISKLGAIVQKLNAIESFSNVKVVCTDKTGTLTQNKLSIHLITKFDNEFSNQQVDSMLGTYANLTSDKNATINAINVFEPDKNYSLTDEFPFSSERKLSMIEASDEKQKTIFILGAFDVLSKNLNPEFKSESEKLFNDHELSVYRNLLFGKIISHNSLNEINSGFDKIEIEPVCIISIKDKIREDVFEAIQLFNENGIQIKILSGDSAKAIQEVAKEIGWKITDNDMVSGNELDKMNDEEFRTTVLGKIIFARLKPENKLKIIQALKKEKIYTAMLGDGVNDLPAIKEADMGIAMEEGSSITKEVADIVLLENKFSLLPSIFSEGNKIVNTVNSIGKLFITKNFFVIYITLMSLLFLLEFPLTPGRVSLINVFGIALPAFIITLKNSNTEKGTNFMKDLISFVVLSALIIVAAGYIGVYFAKKFYNISESDIQMVMLTIMIITNIANYFSIVLTKNESKNHLTYLLYGFMILILYIFFAATKINTGIIHFIKFFYEIDFVPPDLWQLIMLISITASVILFAAQKIRNRIINKS